MATEQQQQKSPEHLYFLHKRASSKELDLRNLFEEDQPKELTDLWITKEYFKWHIRKCSGFEHQLKY